MKDINILSLDMEYNQPTESIIQVGIAIGNLASGNILHTDSWYIYQEEIISDYITKLTGITQSNIDNDGVALLTVYNKLKELHAQYKCFRNALTWGGGDSEDLRVSLNIDKEEFLFGRRWIDAKTLFVSRCFANSLKHQSGLARSMCRLGLQFRGTKHNATDDALNTFIIYRKLLEEYTND